MASAARKLVTVEDWINIPSEERCELIEGEIVYKALPSSEHSCSQSAIDTNIKSEYQYKRKGSKGWWIMTEASVVYEGRPNGFIHDVGPLSRAVFFGAIWNQKTVFFPFKKRIFSLKNLVMKKADFKANFS